MSIYVFAGPSVSKKEIHNILYDAIHLPPIKRGDLLSLPLQCGDYVLIIDGYFYQQPAIQHMEIMDAIRAGVTVIGCSSMGALRAAELYSIGMIGIGYVFNSYYNEMINGDDEVAILHDSNSYEMYSEALINIRFNLEKAVGQKIISPKMVSLIVEECKKKWFGLRTLDSIYRFLERRNHKEQAQQLKQFFTDNYVDIKKQDAIQALNVVRSLSGTPPVPLHKTCFNQNLIREYKKVDGDSTVLENQVLTYCRLFESQFPDVFKRISFDLLKENLIAQSLFKPNEGTDDWDNLNKYYSKELIEHWIYPLKIEPGILWIEPLMVELKKTGLFESSYQAIKAGQHIHQLKKMNKKERILFFMERWEVHSFHSFMEETKKRGYADLAHFLIDLERLCS